MRKYFRIAEDGRGNVLSRAQREGLSLEALLSRNKVIGSARGKDYTVPLVTLRADNDLEWKVGQVKQSFRNAGFLDPNLSQVLDDAVASLNSAEAPEVVYIYASGRMLSHTLIHHKQKPKVDAVEEDGKPTYNPVAHKMLSSNGEAIGGSCIFFHPFAWRYMAEAIEQIQFLWSVDYAGYKRGRDTYASIGCHVADVRGSNLKFFGFAPFMQAPKDGGYYVGDWVDAINPALDVSEIFRHNYGDFYINHKYTQARYGDPDLAIDRAPLKFNLSANGVKLSTAHNGNSVTSESFDYVPIFVGERSQNLQSYYNGLLSDGENEKRFLLTDAITCTTLENIQQCGLKNPWYRGTEELGGTVELKTMQSFASEAFVPPHKTAKGWWEDLYRNLLYAGYLEVGEYSDGTTGACGVVYDMDAGSFDIQDYGVYLQPIPSLKLGRYDGLTDVSIFHADVSPLKSVLYHEYDEVGVSVNQSYSVFARGVCDKLSIHTQASISVHVKMTVSPNWRLLTDEEIKARINQTDALLNVIYTDAREIDTDLPLIENRDINLGELLNMLDIDWERTRMEEIIKKLTQGFTFTLSPYGGSYISVNNPPRLIVEAWRD